MAERPKEYDLSLIQMDPHREARLKKMRSKLANYSPPPSNEVRRKAAGRGKAFTWAIRIGIAAAVVGANYLVVDKKDVILAQMGYEGVPSLPKARESLSLEDQALYYTYALYDIGKFRDRFGMDAYFAMDQKTLRAALDDLLPHIDPATLGEISAYAPVAFKSVSMGGIR